MLLTFMNRHQIIAALGPQSEVVMAELGVWQGDFSEHCLNSLTPRTMLLVDAWSAAEYRPSPAGAPQFLQLEQRLKRYFGDDLEASLETAYAGVCERFHGKPNVKIERGDTWSIAKAWPDESFDIIYLDANHRYENALGDLYAWYPKLKPGGLFFCNDFYESRESVAQNLGVIAAYTTFSKRSPTVPLVLTATDYADLVFTNDPESKLADKLCQAIVTSGEPVVRIPNHLVASFHHADLHGKMVPSLDFFRNGA